MQINIASRLHPFSHTPGISLLLPQSVLELQVFPTRLKIESQALDFNLLGPLTGFTVEQDLERGEVSVFAHAKQGYFRYFIRKIDKGIELFFKKCPENGITLTFQDKSFTFTAGENFFIPWDSKESSPTVERLSLGMHKSQDWDLVKRRADLKEIFPVWLKISAFLPEVKIEHKPVGTLTLLYLCESLINEKEKNALVPAFTNLFHAGFQGILTPRLSDLSHLGLCPISDVPQDLSPLILLKEGARLIKSLFFKEEEQKIFLLPVLPPEFHAGRFINLKTKTNDLIDMEWSKKLLQKVIIRSSEASTKTLILQKSIKRFRIRKSMKDKGLTLETPATLHLHPSKTLYLDHFEE